MKGKGEERRRAAAAATRPTEAVTPPPPPMLLQAQRYSLGLNKSDVSVYLRVSSLPHSALTPTESEEEGRKRGKRE